MSAVMLTTMIVCFALTISVAVSIGLAAVFGIQASNANALATSSKPVKFTMPGEPEEVQPQRGPQRLRSVGMPPWINGTAKSRTSIETMRVPVWESVIYPRDIGWRRP